LLLFEGALVRGGVLGLQSLDPLLPLLEGGDLVLEHVENPFF